MSDACWNPEIKGVENRPGGELRLQDVPNCEWTKSGVDVRLTK